MKKLRKPLSLLLTLTMVLSLFCGMSTVAHAAPYSNDYIDFEFSSTPAIDTDLTVYVQDEDGVLLGDPIIVSDFPSGAIASVTITSLQSDYEILSVEKRDGSASITSPDNQKDQYKCNLYSLGGGSITVTLCEASEPPQVEGDEFTGGLVEYRVDETQALKMLYLAGVPVSAETSIESVKMKFIQTYALQEEESFNKIGTGANNLAYWTASLSALTDTGKPDNIRYLEISYDNGAGEQTARIPSGDLLYVNDVQGTGAAGDLNICEIKARDNDTHIVAFLIEAGGQLDMWSLYDVIFVEDGENVGLGNMPEPPEYATYEHSNWATDPNGVNEFHGNESITEDTMVYGMKSSSSLAGTEIHVMNTDNRLVNRVVELYNANHPENQITAADLDLDSMKIKVTGDSASTNPDYSLNGWNTGSAYDYYFVTNSELPGLVDELTNHHVPHNEISSMTVYVETEDGTPIEVMIPRGYQAGAFSGTLTGKDNIFEIIINAAPDAPENEDLMGDPENPEDPGILGDEAVKVQCENSHAPETYAVLSGSYEIGAVTPQADGSYTCDITIKAEKYVQEYNTVYPSHTLVGESTKKVTLIWEDEDRSWVAQGNTTPVVFYVTCDTTEKYNLTYDANGGYWGTASDTTRTETDLPAGPHTLIYSDTSATAVSPAPTHAPVQKDGKEVKILFVGWSLAEEMKGEILDKDGTPIGLITSGSINMNQSFTVYAVWAEDSNGNDVPDYQEEAITVNFNLKGGTTTDTTSFTLKPFPEKTDIKFGTAPAVTPPTGQEFVNWTLQGDSTKTLGNRAGFTYDSIFEMTGGKKTTVTFEANYQSSNAITITPADITIYMGGDGYEGTVTDEEGDMAGSGTKNGFPEPGFTVTLPQSLKDADMSKLFLRYEEADVVSYTWKFEKYGEGNHNIYRIVPVEGTASRPVRLEFTKGDLTITEDTFDVNLNLNQTLDMTVYGEGIDQELVFFEYERNQYDISVGTGNLTVRGTSDHAQYGVVNKEIADGAPGLEAESGTTYVVNDSTVTVEDPSGIALLFDDVIETNTVENVTNTDLLEAKADTYLGGADPDRQYEFKYLDLVDQNNGNAWVKANGTLTVYWPLPADADPDTLQILHFADVDRSTETDDIAGEISGCEVEKVTIKEVTDTHVVFEVTNSSFSPFALVYETKTTPPQETVTVTFKVVNGTWSNGSSSNIKVTVTKGDSLTRGQIPTGMEPDPGYKKTGSWNTTPNTTIKLNSNVTYTYTFTKSGDTEPEDEDCILYFESNGGTEFKKIDNGNDSFRINPYSDSEYGQHIPSRPGYRFTGWYRDEDLENRISESTKINVNSIMTIYAGWERTSVPSMLNGDDHYAYIQGYADGTVRPNANITRAQVATIFFRLLDEDVRSDYLTTYNTFPDVNADYWANTAISTMASLGVINGRNSGLFDPDAYITRAEFAAICARFDDSNVSGFDSFTDTFGHWAEEEIGRAAALGWIQGYDDGTFRPNQYITRAQAVTMINRVLCRLPEDEDDLLPGMNVWTDCREGDWCYLAIQEATNSHDYVTKDRVYETWTDLNRAPDWSRYE